MKKVLLIVFIFVLSLIVILLVGKDLLITQLVPKVASDILGTTVRVDAIQLKLLRSEIEINGLRINQPVGFGDEALLELKHAEIHYDLGALLARKYHFAYVGIDINQIMIVKNSQGKLSIEALKPVAASLESSSSAEKKTTPKAPAPQVANIDLKIQKLRLNIQPVILRHMNADASLKDEKYELGLRQQEHDNIITVNDLINRLVVSASGLRGMTNAAFFAGHSVFKGVNGVIDDAQDLTTGTLNAITKGAGGVVQKTGNFLKSIVNEF